ncbi:permease [Clostridium carboxidivorans P7]|uniref:Auxin Efflux Carrier n=1 Tax=Clostridium carboxidivorans P7 TaxID=536227 RepID=C6Q1J2_9CLOT|nr:AEC family transporter [Clostridium carboxidivorans]AKN31078.1 permease [Clostridium carboxidivorans P7]EET84631.1 Auxin Efflux Carrier [Clostridium carboxidivorans P7]EFG88655.1 transporter, auxin efflux carrier (AEC) family protein [Clostridium carboxidivorans P7]
MEINTVITQIISLFLVALVGFYGGKKNIIDENFSNGLSKLLVEITTPFLVISSFSISYGPDVANNVIKAFIYSFAIFILTPLLVKPLLIKIDKSKRNVLEFAMIFSNCGFMGFPVAQSVFGNEGVVYAAIFNMIFNIFVWTYGVMLFNNKSDIKGLKESLKNPGVVSSVIGLLIMIFSIKIPPILLNTTKMVGGLTTPISMLIIGSLLSRSELKKIIKDKSMYYGSMIKLILLPLILYWISLLFKENSMVLKTFILMQAMPAGALTTIFAENFNKNKEYSAFIVSFSSLLSVVTIPLVIKFFL